MIHTLSTKYARGGGEGEDADTISLSSARSFLGIRRNFKEGKENTVRWSKRKKVKIRESERS